MFYKNDFLVKLQNTNDLEKIRYLFQDIRFHMGYSVLDGVMGEAYADNLESPRFAILMVRRYCFLSGDINVKNLNDILKNMEGKIIIPSDNLISKVENLLHNYVKKERYSIQKDPCFNKKKLENYVNLLPEGVELVSINADLAKRINQEQFITITDNYSVNGLGYCCMKDDSIIGVASSNIVYKDGIEVNIKVKEEYRRQGIATVLASKLILECLNRKLKISWDAANINSLKLAEKLGFVYDSTYTVYDCA